MKHVRAMHRQPMQKKAVAAATAAAAESSGKRSSRRSCCSRSSAPRAPLPLRPRRRPPFSSTTSTSALPRRRGAAAGTPPWCFERRKNLGTTKLGQREASPPPVDLRFSRFSDSIHYNNIASSRESITNRLPFFLRGGSCFSLRKKSKNTKRIRKNSHDFSPTFFVR